MRALTVIPGIPHSAELRDVPEPPRADGDVLVRTLSIGVCGTDTEILSGEYGSAPPGCDYLILGHESLGVVEEAPAGSGFQTGDLVAAIVRHPDPLPCPSCASGEWDMCSNGNYTERGIKSRHGFGSERFRMEPEFLVHIDPALGQLGVLVEPATTAAKAWEQIDRIGQRSLFRPKTVAITGAGPIGLLVALLGAQRGLEVHLIDLVEEGVKPALARALRATYTAGGLHQLAVRPDIIIECTGAPGVIVDALDCIGSNGIVCLVGNSPKGSIVPLDLGALSFSMVLGNKLVFGSVNANRRHFAAAAQALVHADPAWLTKLITRREPLDAWPEALSRRPSDVKVVIDFSELGS